ncbi:hypothetical protein CCR96_06550 [Halochromatium roseum]|nr:hypothetical protein [Halochromatium roseum]
MIVPDKTKRDLTQAGASQADWPLFVLPLPAAIAALVALIGGQLGMLLGHHPGIALAFGLLTLLGVHLAYGLDLSFQTRLRRRPDLGSGEQAHRSMIPFACKLARARA